MTDHPLLADLSSLLASGAPADTLAAALERICAHFDCPVGTLHRLDPKTHLLNLRAQRGLPPPVLQRVETIPIGKGMAGIAAERREPVQVCNLQTDDSGVVRPGAKETKMEGSLAVPILVAGELRGTLGIAKPAAYEFSEAETELLLAAARLLGERFGENS